MNNQAKELNEIIEKNSSIAYSLLSTKGKEIFFPKKGILSQSQAAKKVSINATIGEAVDNNGKPMFLKSIKDEICIAPELVFPYAPSSGKMNLREKWKELLYIKNPSLKNKEISLPVVSCALTHGLNITGYMFVDPNDTVLIPDLYWENYDLIFGNSYNANLKKYKLFADRGLDIASLQDNLLAGGVGKKILLLNFPNNPTGYTPTKKEAEEIVNAVKNAAAQGNKILIIIDDAYFGLEYEENIISESLFALLADVHENVLTVKLDGPTKEDYVWGFRVGFITLATKNANKDLYAALEQKVSGAIRGNISNASNLAQSLLFNAYSSETYQKEKDEKYEILKSRYSIIKDIFDKNQHYKEVFEPLPYNSGYFMCIKLKGVNEEDLRKLLLEKYDTGVIAMSGVIRIAYSSVNGKIIPQLFDNIYNAAKELQ